MCSAPCCKSQMCKASVVASLVCACAVSCPLRAQAVPLGLVTEPHQPLSWNQTTAHGVSHVPVDLPDIASERMPNPHQYYAFQKEKGMNHRKLERNKALEAVADATPPQDHMVTLKIVGAFATGLASLGGVLPPVLGWGNTLTEGSEPPAFFWLRSFSAGIMVALALVHIIAESFDVMDGLCGDYPIAAIFVMGGVLIMILIERVSMDVGLSNSCSSTCQTRGFVETAYVSPCERHIGTGADMISKGAECSNTANTCIQRKPNATPEACCGEIDGMRMQVLAVSKDLGSTPTSEQSDATAAPTASTDTAFRKCNAGFDAVQDSGENQTKDPVLMLGMLEVGISVHSLVIGMDLGVMEGKPNGLVGLILALVFHQLFEGVGLGAFVASVSPYVTPWNRNTAVCLFSFTLPLGVLIGIGLSFVKFDGDSEGQRWLRGGLDGLSGGILLYLALVHFIAEDLSRVDINRAHNFWLRWQMLACMLLGALAMAVIQIWA